MLVLMVMLAAAPPELSAALSVGDGKPLSLEAPVDVSVTLTNQGTGSWELGWSKRMPLLLYFTSEQPSQRIGCARTVLLTRGAPDALGPQQAARVTLRCESFDSSPLARCLPPGRYKAHVGPLAAAGEVPSLPLAPASASFEVTPPPGVAPSRAPTRDRFAGLDASITQQFSESTTVYGGAIGEDGSSSVSRRESMGVRLRLRATGRAVEFLHVDLFARPVQTRELGAEEPPRGACIGHAGPPSETWEAAGPAQLLWTGPISNLTDNAPWDGRVKPRQTLELSVEPMSGPQLDALRAAPHTYLVRLVDSRMRAHWLESLALSYSQVSCKAP